MAKRTCPYCKEKTHVGAMICKHCKSSLPPLPPKKWYQTWAGFFAILFVLGILGQAFKDDTATNSLGSSTNVENTREAPPKIDKEATIKKLTEEVRQIPASDYQKNLSIYKCLLTIDPANSQFKKKVAHYQTVADKEALKRRKKVEAKAEEAGLRLLAMAERGYLRFDDREGFVFIRVEGKFWGAMTHIEKEQLCSLASTFYRAKAQKKNDRPPTIIFQDMTTGSKLADVSVYTSREDIRVIR